MPCISGEKFGKFLTDRTEYIDRDILEDWFPNEDAWVGHVATGKWDAFDGTAHSFDRFHMAYPDLTGARESLNNASCVGTPCDPTEKKVGYGMTRSDYELLRESFTTDLVCWDQNLTISQAKEKWAMFVKGLRKVTKTVNSNRFKVEAMKGAVTFYLSGAAGATVAVNVSADETVIDTGGVYPTSKLTMQYLQRFVEPLQLEGYFQEKFVPLPQFKLITDFTTSYDLQQGNAALAALFRFEDFKKGGVLYQYGASNAVGNFMIAIDSTPLRFNKQADGTLKRVFPYENVAATVGIKQEFTDQYLNAEFQLSFIWHPMAMRILVLQGQALNPEMPFLVRDFAGQWRFAMDNIVIDGQAVDNKRRNKGLWYADFTSGTKYERPELVRAILHLREPACVADVQRCATAEEYETQNTSSANTPCVSTFTFTVTDLAPFEVNEVTCNGVPIDYTASGSLASAAELETWLNANLGQLGTWDAVTVDDVTTVTLIESSCSCVTIDIATFTA